MLAKNLQQLCVKLSNNGSSEYVVPGFLFEKIMRRALANIQFDEKWYLNKYPDVREAIERGAFKSAKEHYVLNGYFEHRFPYDIRVDEDFYLETNPDVAEAITRMDFEDAQSHFELAGFAEGRLPNPEFAIF